MLGIYKSFRHRIRQERGGVREESARMYPQPELLTLKEAVRVLRVHPNSVRRWAHMGLIRGYRLGSRGHLRFWYGDVVAFLRESEEVMASEN